MGPKTTLPELVHITGGATRTISLHAKVVSGPVISVRTSDGSRPVIGLYVLRRFDKDDPGEWFGPSDVRGLITMSPLAVGTHHLFLLNRSTQREHEGVLGQDRTLSPRAPDLDASHHELGTVEVKADRQRFEFRLPAGLGW